MYKFYIAKYRTIQKNCTIVDPLFPSFLHHHCLQILYTTNFLRMFLYLVSFTFFVTTSIQVYMYFATRTYYKYNVHNCVTKSSRCNSHVYCLATQLCYICSCSTCNRSKLARQALPLRSSYLDRLSSVHNAAS